MDHSNDSGKIITGLLVGALIGGALGILYAPYKGTKTRRKLRSKGEDLKELIQDQFAEIMEHLQTAPELEVAATIK
jgi:gas vesicle protein